MISIAMFCCEDDPPPFIDVPEELVGQWTLVSEVSANCPNPNNNGTVPKDCTAQDCLEYTFEADGTLTRRFIEDGNRQFEVNSFTLDGVDLYIDKGAELDIFSYELFQGQLNLIYRSPTTRCTVIQVFEMD